jgi:hypothetical protein
MEEWFRKQCFFTEEKLERIIAWTKGDKIEFISDREQYTLGVA